MTDQTADLFGDGPIDADHALALLVLAWVQAMRAGRLAEARRHLQGINSAGVLLGWTERAFQ